MDWIRAWNTFQAYCDLLLRRTRPRAYPLELSLGTSSYCNLRCIMCPREGHEGNRMPFDQPVSADYFHGLAPYLRRANEVSLYGLGEPFIDKEYFRKVEFVHSFGTEVILSTNGILMDEKRRREIIRTNLRGLGISLDAVTEKTYSIIRPPGGFSRIVENLKALVAMRNERHGNRPLIALSFAMMRQNLHEVAAFPELVKSIGADEAIFHTSLYMSHAMKERIEPDAELQRKAVAETIENARKLNVKLTYWNLDPMTYLRSLEYTGADSVPQQAGRSYYCRHVWRNAMLQGEGELFPCCYMTNHRVGTLEEGDLRVLRRKPFMAELRELHFEGRIPGPCRNCPQLVPYRRKQLLREAWSEIRSAWKHSWNGGMENKTGEEHVGE
ncbi:MAG TPA: radical SAM protein [bacterium]|nr:radical SAM protein [bacterium]HPO07470.1 radical SAM protein [bacterium]HQP99064.1 radical SAM protein [bacterium]